MKTIYNSASDLLKISNEFVFDTFGIFPFYLADFINKDNLIKTYKNSISNSFITAVVESPLIGFLIFEVIAAILLICALIMVELSKTGVTLGTASVSNFVWVIAIITFSYEFFALYVELTR